MDDSEVTLNVCLGNQFVGGELFFRGTRCEKHVNTATKADVCHSFLLLSCLLTFCIWLIANINNSFFSAKAGNI